MADPAMHEKRVPVPATVRVCIPLFEELILYASYHHTSADQRVLCNERFVYRALAPELQRALNQNHFYTNQPRRTRSILVQHSTGSTLSIEHSKHEATTVVFGGATRTAVVVVCKTTAVAIIPVPQTRPPNLFSGKRYKVTNKTQKTRRYCWLSRDKRKLYSHTV